MPSIDQIMQRRQEKMAERPQFDGGTDFALRDDKTANSVAMAVAYSLYSGQEGDPYLEYYLGHGYDAIGKNGGRYTRIVYCPVESGHDENYDCQGCKEGVKLKDRFAMWLYVDKILYNSLVGDEKYVPENWLDGNRYFAQPVGRPMYWDTSGWKDSCLGDIHMLAKQLGDLRKTRVTIKATGTGIDKRYKFYPEMGSPPIDGKLYEECQGQIRPVLEVLRDSIATVPTIQRPEEQEPVVLPFPDPKVTPIAAPPAPPFSGPVKPPEAAATEAPALPPFKAPNREKLF